MVHVLIHTDSRYPVNRKIVRKAIDDTLKKFKIDNDNFEVSVAVVGARKMKVIGDKYLNDGKKHEILSFPFEEISSHRDGAQQGFISAPDGILRLGDIVLCWPEVVSLAASEASMVDDKIYDLIGHGMEHLMGKHHE